MFTSNYAHLAEIKPPLAPISISRAKPRWLKGGWKAHVAAGTIGRNYDALAPKAAALKASDEEYDRAFAAILAALDPAKVFADLGENAVLLCYCKVGVFCHRRLVAEWFEHHLGVIVPELGVDRLETAMCVTPAYEWYADMDAKYEWLEAKLGREKGSSL